ncbi:hypothetical protein [Streptomyces sp. NPDC006334]|uniref:hypothetical protein n=1 Tax=Streptomyces sp. NPDC006334 TaxID=3156754 RepID=UPI0033AB59C1
MQILVTAQGYAAQNSTSNGITAVGSVPGTLRARVNWPGVWITDGDPIAMDAQEQQVRALFPDVDITEMTITPVTE